MFPAVITGTLMLRSSITVISKAIMTYVTNGPLKLIFFFDISLVGCLLNTLNLTQNYYPSQVPRWNYVLKCTIELRKTYF